MTAPARRRRRAAMTVAALAAIAALAGAVYERIGRHRAARDFPPPGKMVDVGGRRIQIDCRGSGSPTVVFEAGLSIDGALSWSAVQPRVADRTRTCSYSRAGWMWSDPPGQAPNARQVARDLHAALAAAGEKGPFVLVGQSLGALYSVGFTRDFGAEVGGLVLVDPSHPEQVERVAGCMTETRSLRARIAVALAWTGLLRAAAPLLVPQAPNQSAHELAAVRAFAPQSLRTQLAEGDATDAVLAEAKAFPTLGDRPLVVLTAMAPYSAAELRGMQITPAQGLEVQQLWKRMHEEIAAWSSRSRHVLLPKAGHDIQRHDPEAVVEAVMWVVEAVRRDAGRDPIGAPER